MIRFKGNEIRFNIGFKILNIRAKKNPPIMKLIYPPVTLTPGRIKVRVKRANVLKKEFLIKPFITSK